MRLSTRARYGVRAMLDLALLAGEGPVNLRAMSGRQDISADYLEQLLRRLRKAGLARSVRGPKGGFLLAKPAADIRIWEIVVALEDRVAPARCVNNVVGRRSGGKPCRRMSDCATHVLWGGLAKQIRAFLEAKTLQGLAEDARRLCDRTEFGDPIVFEI